VRGVVPEHRNVSIAIDADGRPVVAWGESGADDQMRIFVRRSTRRTTSRSRLHCR
jgi:hypothetical protein